MIWNIKKTPRRGKKILFFICNMKSSDRMYSNDFRNLLACMLAWVKNQKTKLTDEFALLDALKMINTFSKLWISRNPKLCSSTSSHWKSRLCSLSEKWEKTTAKRKFSHEKLIEKFHRIILASRQFHFTRSFFSPSRKISTVHDETMSSVRR